MAVLGRGGGQTIQRRKLCEIIEARMGEIYSLIREEVKRSGHAGMLPAGAVLTGGGARLAGVDELARDDLEMPVRVGSPQGVGGLMDQIGNPAFSTPHRPPAVGRPPRRRGADRLRHAPTARTRSRASASGSETCSPARACHRESTRFAADPPLSAVDIASLRPRRLGECG